MADAVTRLEGDDACQPLAHVVAQGCRSALLARPQQVDAIFLAVGRSGDAVIHLVALEQHIAAANEQEGVARAAIGVHDRVVVCHRVVAHDDGVLLVGAVPNVNIHPVELFPGIHIVADEFVVMDIEITVLVTRLELEMNHAFAQVVDDKLVSSHFKSPPVAAMNRVGCGGEYREVHVVEQAVNEFVIVLIVELVVVDLDIGTFDVASSIFVGIIGLAEES